MKKLWFLAVPAVAVLATVALAAGPGIPGGRGGMPGAGFGRGGGMGAAGASAGMAGLEKFFQEIDATAEQRDKITPLAQRIMDEFRALKLFHAQSHYTLRQEWLAPLMDEARLHGIVDEMSARVADFGHKFVSFLVAVHGLLTPDQRMLASEMRHKGGPAAQGGMMDGESTESSGYQTTDGGLNPPGL